jgi:hypothetical protein
VELRQVIREQLGPQRHALRQRQDFLERRVGRGGAPHFAGYFRAGADDARALSRLQQIQQRIGLADAAATVAAQVEVLARQPVLAETLHEVMLERIHAGGGHVRIGAQIVAAVELGDRTGFTGESPPQEMGEAELTRRHIVIGPVPDRVEKRHRTPARRLAVLHIMQQRVGVGGLRIVGAIIAGIEIRVRPAVLAPAVAMPVNEGAVAARRQVGVAIDDPLAVEQAGALQQHQPSPLGDVRHGRRPSVVYAARGRTLVSHPATHRMKLRRTRPRSRRVRFNTDFLT